MDEFEARVSDTTEKMKTAFDQALEDQLENFKRRTDEHFAAAAETANLALSKTLMDITAKLTQIQSTTLDIGKRVALVESKLDHAVESQKSDMVVLAKRVTILENSGGQLADGKAVPGSGPNGMIKQLPTSPKARLSEQFTGIVRKATTTALNVILGFKLDDKLRETGKLSQDRSMETGVIPCCTKEGVRTLLGTITSMSDGIVGKIRIEKFSSSNIFRLAFPEGAEEDMWKLLNSRSQLRDESGAWVQRDVPKILRALVSNAHKVGRAVKETSTMARGKFYRISDDNILEIDDIPIAPIYLLPSSNEKINKFVVKLDEELNIVLSLDWKARTLRNSVPVLEQFCFDL
jgi:hypothetical protein